MFGNAVPDAHDDEGRNRQGPDRLAKAAAQLLHAGEFGAHRQVAAALGDHPSDDHQ